MSSSPIRLLLLALAALAPAAAQAAQVTYVSAFGRDVAPCSRFLPCRTFQRALAVTDPGGAIVALDSARFSNEFLDIRKSVTISAAPGVRAELTSTNGGVYVNAAGGDTVVLRGLTFTGQNTPPNNAIVFNGGDALHVEECVVSGWPTKGILALGGPGRVLYVKDSIFRDNYIGVAIDAAVLGSIDRARFEHNTFGLSLTVRGKATVRDSVASGNSDAGFLSSGFGANNFTELSLESCMATGNGTGVRAEGFSGAAGLARVSNSIVTNNGTGLHVGAAGGIESRGNNTVAGNTTDVDGLLTPLAGR